VERLAKRWLLAYVAHVYEVAATVLPFIVFALSISPEPGSWDTAEMQGVPYILGIAHPTGFPLYTIFGYLFTHIFAVGTIAFRLNIFSALCVSLACLTLYLAAREFSVPKVCALAGALWFAVTAIVWTHASRAEVHDLALVLCALTVLFCIRWQKNGNTRDFWLAALMLGLALATHPIAVWLFPGAVFVCIVKPPGRRTLLRAVLTVVACLFFYAYLPIRSAFVKMHHLDPTLSLTGIQGGIFWNYNDPSTLHGLLAEVTGSQFGAGGTVLSIFNLSTTQTYLWSWLTVLNGAYGVFGMGLAAIGLARLWSMDWKATISLLLLTLAAVPFSFAYAGVEGDIDRYRMLSLWMVPILMGASAAIRQPSRNGAMLLRTAVVCVLMLMWGAQTMQNNWALFDERKNSGGRALITETQSRIPAGSVIVTTWLDATSLAYGAYVDGSLPGRTIVAGWAADYRQYYRSWAKTHTVFLIGNNGHVPGVRLRRVGMLDGSHPFWRVVP
jgi:Protein of unknown function (DUF2723)